MVVKDGKLRREARPREEWIAASVPEIIPREVFDQVQRRLAENWRHAKRNTRREYLLAGLVKHACGSRMGGRYNKGTVYYRCYMSHRHKAPINEVGEPQPCGGTWVNGRKLEAAVWDTVTDLLQRPELLMREMERLSGPDSTTREALEEELTVVLERLKNLPQEERRLVQGYRKGLYADFMMREEMERVSIEKDENQRRRDDLRIQIDRLDRAKAYKGQVQAFARRVSKGLDNMDFNQRRELLRLLVDEVIYDEGKVTIKTIIPLDKVQLHPEAQGFHGGREGEVERGHGEEG